MELEKNLFPVQGNFADVVYTNALLHSSVQSLYKLIPKMKQNFQNIYNLNQGAKIHQAIPKHIEDLNTNAFESIDKDELFKELQDTLNKNSIDQLSEADIRSIKLRLLNAKDTYTKLEEFSNNVSLSNQDKYLYDLLGIVSYILHKQGRENITLTSAYLLFFKYALTTILDFFNTKEIKNEKRHIKKFNKLIENEMCDICNIYINALEKFIKERC
jgi:hypothetical protein